MSARVKSDDDRVRAATVRITKKLVPRNTGELRAPRFFQRDLAALAFRGMLSPRRAAVWIGVLVLLACHDWAPSYSLLGGDALELRAEALARAFTRRGIWTGACVLLAPFLVMHAARTSGRWSAGDELWLGTRAIGRAAVVCSTWLGAWAASVVLVLGTALFIEVTLPESNTSYVARGSIQVPAVGWVTGDAPARWRTADRAASEERGARIAIELGLGSGVGAASEVVLRARRVVDDASTSGEMPWTASARARIATRGTIELELPRGPGALELELACADRDARFFVLSRAAPVWVPTPSERSASVEIALRTALVLAVWLAIAIALGTMLRPGLATALVLVLWIAMWLVDGVPSSVPGADLARALDITGRGRVPERAGVLAFAVAAGTAAIALFAGSRTLGRWWTRA